VTKYLSDNSLTYTALMSDFLSRLSSVPDDQWTTEHLHEIVEIKPDEDRARWTAEMRVARLALTGGEPGPSVAETMAVLGRDRVQERFQNVEERLVVHVV